VIRSDELNLLQRIRFNPSFFGAKPIIRGRQFKGLCVLFLLVAWNVQARGQSRAAAAVFKPAVDEIISKVRVPILLPSKLPAAIRERDIKLASGTVSETGYEISIYYSEVGSDAAFAAGFSGSTLVFNDLPNTRPVILANKIAALFRPVSCGGSCAPANLWWQQDGTNYQIQIKLRSTTNVGEQQRILLEIANSVVTVRKP
jgi:hypothetical protein